MCKYQWMWISCRIKYTLTEKCCLLVNLWQFWFISRTLHFPCSSTVQTGCQLPEETKTMSQLLEKCPLELRGKFNNNNRSVETVTSITVIISISSTLSCPVSIICSTINLIVQHILFHSASHKVRIINKLCPHQIKTQLSSNSSSLQLLVIENKAPYIISFLSLFVTRSIFIVLNLYKLSK